MYVFYVVTSNHDVVFFLAVVLTWHSLCRFQLTTPLLLIREGLIPNVLHLDMRGMLMLLISTQVLMRHVILMLHQHC